jgi:hypothetical protein
MGDERTDRQLDGRTDGWMVTRFEPTGSAILNVRHIHRVQSRRGIDINRWVSVHTTHAPSWLASRAPAKGGGRGGQAGIEGTLQIVAARPAEKKFDDEGILLLLMCC